MTEISWKKEKCPKMAVLTKKWKIFIKAKLMALKSWLLGLVYSMICCILRDAILFSLDLLNFSRWNFKFFSISDLSYGTNQDFMPFIQAQFFVARYPQKLHSDLDNSKSFKNLMISRGHGFSKNFVLSLCFGQKMTKNNHCGQPGHQIK